MPDTWLHNESGDSQAHENSTSVSPAQEISIFDHIDESGTKPVELDAPLISDKLITGDVEHRAKQASNWLLGEFSRLLNAASPDTSWTSIEVAQSRVAPGHLSELLDLLEDGTLSQPMAKAVFEEMFHTGKAPRVVVEEKGMAQISQAGELEGVVAAVLQAHPQAVADYRSGKATALTYLVGQVMKATRGQANPALVNRLLREKLEVSER